jgi:hypothetical protein
MTTNSAGYNIQRTTSLHIISHKLQTDSDVYAFVQGSTRKQVLKNTNAQSTLATIRFPFSSFRYYLTLFSKFFSSFPHGTCSLSVSHKYLALDGIYHLLWAVLPNNSTPKEHTFRQTQYWIQNGSITLYATLFQGTLSSQFAITYPQ